MMPLRSIAAFTLAAVASVAEGGNQNYMQYSQNSSEQDGGWQRHLPGGGTDPWVPDVHNRSDRDEWADAFRHRYADQWVQKAQQPNEAPAQRESVGSSEAPAQHESVGRHHSAESAEVRYDRAHGEANLTLQELRNLSYEVSSAATDEETVRESMKDSLTEEERDAFTVFFTKTEEFDRLDQQIDQNGSNWSVQEMQDAVQHLEELDGNLTERHEHIMQLVRKADRNVEDSSRDQARSDDERARALARRADHQSRDMEDAARDCNSRRKEDEARSVDERADSLARDVGEGAGRRARAIQEQARRIELSASRDIRTAEDHREESLRQHRAALTAMQEGEAAPQTTPVPVAPNATAPAPEAPDTAAPVVATNMLAAPAAIAASSTNAQVGLLAFGAMLGLALPLALALRRQRQQNAVHLVDGPGYFLQSA